MSYVQAVASIRFTLVTLAFYSGSRKQPSSDYKITPIVYNSCRIRNEIDWAD